MLKMCAVISLLLAVTLQVSADSRDKGREFGLEAKVSFSSGKILGFSISVARIAEFCNQMYPVIHKDMVEIHAQWALKNKELIAFSKRIMEPAIEVPEAKEIWDEGLRKAEEVMIDNYSNGPEKFQEFCNLKKDQIKSGEFDLKNILSNDHKVVAENKDKVYFFEIDNDWVILTEEFKKSLGL